MARKSMTAMVEDALEGFRLEGWRQGRREGRVLGPRAFIVRQLTRRFGPLPPGVAALIDTSTPLELKRWAVQLLDAPTLDSLFGEHADVRAEGRVEGIRALLLGLLQRKVAFLDARVLTRVKAARHDDLCRWLDQILDGDSVDLFRD